MKKQNKERNILIAEIVIVILVILAILLPQLIGTISIAQAGGAWKTYDNLDGKVIGIADDSGLVEFANKVWN